MSDFQKQTVQWFPGHMAKTRRQIKESLPLVDAVTELLDARVPLSSRNPELNELIASKPHIVLLNKCDMADEAATRRWKAWFGRQGSPALAVDCRSGRGLNDYGDTVRELLRDKIQSNLEKGMAGRSRAKVADRPGVTRQNQWFAIGGGIELLDTPGVLWPKFDDPEVGNRLAFIGSVKDEVMDVETMAVRLLAVLGAQYPARLCERYKIDREQASQSEPYELLELIGHKRGMLMRGGEIDTERAKPEDLSGSGRLGRYLSPFRPDDGVGYRRRPRHRQVCRLRHISYRRQDPASL